MPYKIGKIAIHKMDPNRVEYNAVDWNAVELDIKMAGMHLNEVTCHLSRKNGR